MSERPSIVELVAEELERLIEDGYECIVALAEGSSEG